jgi:hypothetical protein
MELSVLRTAAILFAETAAHGMRTRIKTSITNAITN